jgi:acylphosphatase
MVRRLVIGGRVQGVCFRHALAVEARSLGLCGKVRSMATGNSEKIAEWNGIVGQKWAAI